MSRCSQSPCRFKATYDDRCVAHAASAGNEAARAELAARGRAGGARMAAKAAAKKLTTCDLRTADGQVTQLELALLRVVNSGADAVQKAGAVAKLVSEARATIKAAELETENKQLRELLLERHPELRKQLKVVP